MSLSSGDLTTVATVQQYAPDALPTAALPSFIARTSRWILSELNRSSILPRTYNEYFSGTGTGQLILPNWPVLSISSVFLDTALQTEVSNLIVNGISVQNPWSGWSIQSWNGVPPGEPAALLLGSCRPFWGGTRNINVAYQAGYQVTSEAAVVPEAIIPDLLADPPILQVDFVVTPEQPYGTWATDEGVTYANGTALEAIASGTPNAGEYLPPAPDAATPRLVYTFAEADAGADVLLSYGYIPSDLEQLALELILSRNTYRRNAGIRSKTLANQETIVYDNRPLSDFATGILQAYGSVLPPNFGLPL
jgi:hypothetical protein